MRRSRESPLPRPQLQPRLAFSFAFLCNGCIPTNSLHTQCMVVGALVLAAANGLIALLARASMLGNLMKAAGKPRAPTLQGPTLQEKHLAYYQLVQVGREHACACSTQHEGAAHLRGNACMERLAA